MSYSYGEALTSISQLKGRDSVDLLARVIYDEARGESWAGKQGVAAVVANRKKCTVGEFRNQNTVEDVILYPNAFEGVAAGKSTILCPDTTSQAWNDCLYIAMNSATQDNPIGNCLWFLGTSYFNSKVTTQNGFEYYNFGTGVKRIIEKAVIGGHTFFRVEGYTL